MNFKELYRNKSFILLSVLEIIDILYKFVRASVVYKKVLCVKVVYKRSQVLKYTFIFYCISLS